MKKSRRPRSPLLLREKRSAELGASPIFNKLLGRTRGQAQGDMPSRQQLGDLHVVDADLYRVAPMELGAFIVVLFLVTSAILKFNWYDKLEKA